MKGSRSCKQAPGLFLRVKESVSMGQVEEYFGLKVNVRGLAICPFHQDRNPSLKIYPDGKGFYCFTCGVGGDQISFAARFLGIRNGEAAKVLAEAFGIPTAEPSSYREKREAERQARRRREIREFAQYSRVSLMVYYGLLCEAIRERNRHFYEGLENLTWVQYMMEQIEEKPEEVLEDWKAVKRLGELRERLNRWYCCTETDRAISG